jgi:hypothetical protein
MKIFDFRQGNATQIFAGYPDPKINEFEQLLLSTSIDQQ